MTIQAANDAITLTTYTTAEAVIAVLDANPQTPTQQGTVIMGVVNLTPTTSGTAVQLRVRSGSTTGGTAIGTADTTTVIAGSPISVPFAAIDSSVFPTSGQYCLTAKGTGAGGTINDVVMFSDQVSPTK